MSKSRNPEHPILVVDDDPSVLATFRAALESTGFDKTITCQDSREVMDLLSRQETELLLLDLAMPHLSGQELLPRIREKYPDLPVIIVTGSTELTIAIECLKQGVVDYLVKAVEISKLIATVRRVVEIRDLKREVLSLKNHLLEGQLHHPEAFSRIISVDSRMHSIFMYVDSVAVTQQPILITGETGVGKELFASAVHAASDRQGQLVAVNVAGYDDHMFADALFGHVKGAYTGADHPRVGLVGKAAAGTLFLDEIGDLKPESQVKLLRLLENGEYYPLGSDAPEKSQARCVIATNKDLAAEVQAGRFRKDLYFRLNTHHIHVPPLRQRPMDLPLLAGHFVAQAAGELGRKAPALPVEVQALLQAYPFPGNVRELKSLLFDAVSRNTSETLCVELFREKIAAGGIENSLTIEESFFADKVRLPTLEQAADLLIEEAMRRSNRNQAAAAKILGVSPQTLGYRLKKRRSSGS